MNLATLRKAVNLLNEHDRLEKRLMKILASSNGATPKRRKQLQYQARYMTALKKLPRSAHKKLKKIRETAGPKAAVEAAQKMVVAFVEEAR